MNSIHLKSLPAARYVGIIWTPALQRKEFQPCWKCRSAIAKGEVCYRPQERSRVRDQRICTDCMKAHGNYSLWPEMAAVAAVAAETKAARRAAV